MATVKITAAEQPIAPAKITVELSLKEALYLRYLLHHNERAPDSMRLCTSLDNALRTHDERLWPIMPIDDDTVSFIPYLSEYERYLNTNIP